MYRIQEFAAKAGVTVRTLHHYDRIGLLKPRRTHTRYRVYSDADLPRLQRILVRMNQSEELAAKPTINGCSEIVTCKAKGRALCARPHF